MTPEEGAQLHHMGIVHLRNLTASYTATLLYGVFLSIFAIAMYTILRRGLTSRASQAILVLIIVNFALSTMYWAAWVSGFAIQIRTALINNVNLSLKEKFAVTNKATFRSDTVLGWTGYLLPILSDIALIWRAWVLFPGQEWVMIGPLLLLLGLISVTFVYSIMTTVIPIPQLSPHQEHMLLAMDTSTIALSLATNVLATALIGYKLWTHREFLGGLGLRKKNFRVGNVLLILVESGLIYCAIQVTILVLSLLPDSSMVVDTATDYAGSVLRALYFEVSAMYPALIVVIVNQHRSMVDTCGFDLNTTLKNGMGGDSPGSEYRPATAGHLSFASPPADSNHDKE